MYDVQVLRISLHISGLVSKAHLLAVCVLYSICIFRYPSSSLSAYRAQEEEAFKTRADTW